MPIIVIIINNGYLSLIRQAQKYVYNMEFEVNTWYGGQMIDFMKYAETYGAHGERVERPEEIRAALERAVKCGRPAVVEIVVQRDADASMGTTLENIVEHQPLVYQLQKEALAR